MKKFGGSIKTGFKFFVPLGPRQLAAGVHLSISSHESYEFVVAANWDDDDYSRVVERGVRDGLREAGYDPDLGVRVSVIGVESHPVNSSEHCFYIAAKCATKAGAEAHSYVRH